MLIKCADSYHYNWWPNDRYDGSDIGIGSFDLFESKSNKSLPLELWSFKIHENADHGKGYGQMMLREVMEITKNRNVKLYVYRCNEVAIHIYKKVGFEIVEKHMGDEAWEMMRIVEAGNEVEQKPC